MSETPNPRRQQLRPIRHFPRHDARPVGRSQPFGERRLIASHSLPPPTVLLQWPRRLDVKDIAGFGAKPRSCRFAEKRPLVVLAWLITPYVETENSTAQLVRRILRPACHR